MAERVGEVPGDMEKRAVGPCPQTWQLEGVHPDRANQKGLTMAEKEDPKLKRTYEAVYGPTGNFTWSVIEGVEVPRKVKPEGKGKGKGKGKDDVE